MAPKSNKGKGKQRVRPSSSSSSESSPPSNNMPTHQPFTNAPAVDLVNTQAYRAYRHANPYPARTPAQLTRLYNDAQAAGHMPNPGEVPWGPGHWEWQEPHDGLVAAEMGYRNHQEVERARQAGHLPNNPNRGTPASVGPNTVWVPDRSAWNPDSRRTRHGHFAFVVHGDQHLARINLGGQGQYRLARRQDPTADEVFAVRRRQQDRIWAGENVNDPTDGINIVWIPAEDEPDQDEDSDSDEALKIGTGDGELDADTELIHDPTNGSAGGEEDQTGDNLAHYQTRLFNSREITVDRSVARLGQQQPHKCFIVNNNGNSVPWTGWDKMDWNSKTDLTRLNKWREQAFHRHGWSHKRKAAYIDYSKREKKHLFDLVVKGGGRRPATAEALREFNARFPGKKRNAASLEAQIHRMVKMWKEYNGVFQPGVGKDGKKRGKESGSEDGIESSGSGGKKKADGGKRRKRGGRR